MIGGFLAASGILLITGGMEVVTQTNLTLSPSSWASRSTRRSTVRRSSSASLFAVAIPVLGAMGPELPCPCRSPSSLSLFVLDGSLFGVVGDETVRSAWFLPSLGKLTSVVAGHAR